MLHSVYVQMMPRWHSLIRACVRQLTQSKSFVVTLGSRAVSAAVVSFDRNSRQCVIRMLATHPLHQRNGFARVLHTYIHQHARSLNCPHVHVEAAKVQVGFWTKYFDFRQCHLSECILFKDTQMLMKDTYQIDMRSRAHGKLETASYALQTTSLATGRILPICRTMPKLGQQISVQFRYNQYIGCVTEINCGKGNKQFRVYFSSDQTEEHVSTIGAHRYHIIEQEAEPATASCQPQIKVEGESANVGIQQQASSTADSKKIFCTICQGEPKSGADIATLDCGHSFCRTGLIEWWEKQARSCPECRKGFASPRRWVISKYNHLNR